MHFAILIFLFGFLTSGCTKVQPADDGFVSSTISNRIDSCVEWRSGCCQKDFIETIFQGLTSQELTADAAIQIALLNNPKIQAIFEELGIAQADLIQAGLLTNPTFEIELRYPPVKNLHTNIEYLITSSLLDLFLIPLRRQVAEAEFEKVKLQVSHEILNLSFDVRETFYELTSEMTKIREHQSLLRLASIHQEILSNQLSVGNVNPLDFQISQSKFLEAELELSKSKVEMIRLKEKLNRLLGFNREVCLIFPENLSQELIEQGFDLSILENVALTNRLDLQVARMEIERLQRMLKLKSGWTYTNLKGGLAGERDPDGINLLGPGFSGEIPIFNYGQADRKRLYAQLRQSLDLLAELEIKALSEVREAHQLLMGYFNILKDYQNKILPIQDKISASSEELYNVMGLGLETLLESKRQLISAKLNYIETKKKYLLAKVLLDRALGGNLFLLMGQQEVSE